MGNLLRSWRKLILEAKKQGISKEDIKAFLKEKANKHKQTNKKC